MVEWNNKRIILSVPACCDTDSIAGVCGDLLQDTVGLDGTVVAEIGRASCRERV